jgi:predicted tellurium resistance membrane protein TerC
MVIAIRLLLPGGERTRRVGAAQTRFLSAALTIVVADVTMSFDNVLAVGALANGNLVVLFAGLLLSMGLLFAASALVAAFVRRIPWLIDLASVVLAWTAAHLLVQDTWFERTFHVTAEQRTLIYLACIDLVLAVNVGLRAARALRNRRRRSRRADRSAHHATARTQRRPPPHAV